MAIAGDGGPNMKRSRRINYRKGAVMGIEQLESKIEERQAVYYALKAGDASTVCYKEFHRGEWGTNDENYTDLLERAKNANFDCACGYDPNEEVDDDFAGNSLLDCIYLCQEMEYRDAENESLYLEQLTICGTGQKRNFKMCHSQAGTEICIRKGLRRRKP